MTSPATFTVEQANRMLPLVRRIAEDLVTDYARWQSALREFERLALASRIESPDPRLATLQRDAKRLADDVQHYLTELAALGVACKSVETGLVDFPGEVDGEPACLCWQVGEPAVAWWHRPDAGFAGRQPILDALVPNDGSPDDVVPNVAEAAR